MYNNYYPSRSYDSTIPIVVGQERFYVRLSSLKNFGSFFSQAIATYKPDNGVILPKNVCSKPEAVAHVLTYFDTGMIPYNKELWCEYLKLAELFENSDLIKTVIEYVGPDFLEVANMPTFLSLSPQLVTQLLQYNGLKVASELDIFAAAGRWIIANKMSAGTPLGDEVINTVRWPYLPLRTIQMCYEMGEMDIFARPAPKHSITYYQWWRKMYESGYPEIMAYPYPAPRWYYDPFYAPDNTIFEVIAKKFEMVDLEEPFIETYDKPIVVRGTSIWRSLFSKKGSIKSSLSGESVSSLNSNNVRGSILSLFEKFKSAPKLNLKSCGRCGEQICVCSIKKTHKAESSAHKEIHKIISDIGSSRKSPSKSSKKSPSLLKRLSKLKIKNLTPPVSAIYQKKISPIKELEDVPTKETLPLTLNKADDKSTKKTRKSRKSKTSIDSSTKESRTTIPKSRRKSSFRPVEPFEPDKTLADAPPRAEIHFDAPLMDFLPIPIANDIKLNTIYLMASYQISSEEDRQTEACSTCWKMFYSKGWTPIHPMPESKISHTVCAMYGEVYIVGGINLDNRISDEVFAYTEVCDAWRSMPKLAQPKYGCGACEFQRQIFVVGGIGYDSNGQQTILDAVEVYNPFDKVWIQAKPLPKPMCHQGLIESAGNLYHVGGATGKSLGDLVPCNEVYRYDMEYDNWIPYQTLKIPRYKFAIMTVGKYFYVINGICQGGKLTNSIEKFNTETEEWESQSFSKGATAVDPICASIRGQIKAEVWDIPWDHLRLEWDKLNLEEKVLGQGHFGLVKKGIYQLDGAEIPTAVKMLKAAGAGNDPLAEQGAFIETVRELTIMAQLPINPHIVNTIGAIINQGMLYICTEFCTNGDLKSFLGKVKQYQVQCSSNDLLKLAMGIAKGMSHLAENGIIHRDLAARNVLLGDENIPKVCDFGLARDHGLYVRLKYGTKNLPIKWLAPECMTLNRYTEKSDVWAYGVLLYELVTYGDPPYPNMTNMDVKEKVIGGYRMAKPLNCSDEMFDVMKSCWNADPSERPSFAELASTLEQQYIAKTAGTAVVREEHAPAHSWGSGHLWKTLKDLTHKI